MDITQKQKDLMEKHLQLVIEINKTTNLTRIQTPESGRVLHVEDSLVALPEFTSCGAGLYADLGTGGGFPGIPLSIATGRPVVLVDSVGKKTTILKGIAEELDMSDLISTYHGRIEDMASKQPEQYAVLTARALTALPSLLELASPLLKMGGHLISYKASGIDEELAWANSVEDKLGMKLINRRDVVLSDGETKRCILLYRKVHKPNMKLPRRVGMAQKKPYH